MIKYVYVWYNKNSNTYYIKYLRHENPNYYIGYTNDYNHTIVLFDKIYFDRTKYSFKYFKRRTILSLISFLEKI